MAQRGWGGKNNFQKEKDRQECLKWNCHQIKDTQIHVQYIWNKSGFSYSDNFFLNIKAIPKEPMRLHCTGSAADLSMSGGDLL